MAIVAARELTPPREVKYWYSWCKEPADGARVPPAPGAVIAGHVSPDLRPIRRLNPCRLGHREPDAIEHTRNAGSFASSAMNALLRVTAMRSTRSRRPDRSIRYAIAQSAPWPSRKNGIASAGNRSLRGNRPASRYSRSQPMSVALAARWLGVSWSPLPWRNSASTESKCARSRATSSRRSSASGPVEGRPRRHGERASARRQQSGGREDQQVPTHKSLACVGVKLETPRLSAGTALPAANSEAARARSCRGPEPTAVQIPSADQLVRFPGDGHGHVAVIHVRIQNDAHTGVLDARQDLR